MTGTQAQRLAVIDADAAARDIDDFDPMGAFIKRLELHDDVWPEYRDAFGAAFQRQIEAARKDGRIGAPLPPEALAQLHANAGRWQALVLADLAVDPAMRGGQR